MRLIENMLLINVDDKEQHGLLIHTLNGNISVLSKQEKEYIQSWKGKLNIEPTDESERGVYRELMENGYLSEDEEAEARIVDCDIVNINLISTMAEKKYVFIATHKPEQFDFCKDTIML